MQLLDFIFQMGVLFAIYGFLWGLIELGITLLSVGRNRSIGEIYLIKAIKYFFLVDVTFLFCIDGSHSKLVVLEQFVIAAVVLLTYFLGKMEQKQMQMRFFQMGINGMNLNRKTNYNQRAEILTISLALFIYSCFWFKPEIAYNPLSIWFHTSITDIADTPVFGFIFKVIGFFFMLTIIFRFVNAISQLLNGNRSSRYEPPQSDDGFDDFEEIN